MPLLGLLLVIVHQYYHPPQECWATVSWLGGLQLSCGHGFVVKAGTLVWEHARADEHVVAIGFCMMQLGPVMSRIRSVLLHSWTVLVLWPFPSRLWIPLSLCLPWQFPLRSVSNPRCSEPLVTVESLRLLAVSPAVCFHSVAGRTLIPHALASCPRLLSTAGKRLLDPFIRWAG